MFEQRIAALEGGVAALATASGAAALAYTFQALATAGSNIVAAKTIYGGTYNYLAHTFPNYGVSTTFVDPDELSNFENAIDDKTRAVFIESLGNPNSNIVDIKALAELAHQRLFVVRSHAYVGQPDKRAVGVPFEIRIKPLRLRADPIRTKPLPLLRRVRNTPVRREPRRVVRHSRRVGQHFHVEPQNLGVIGILGVRLFKMKKSDKNRT